MKNSRLLPEKLEKLITACGIKEYKIIDINIRKERYCLFAITACGEKGFIKWNEEDNENAYNALLKEIQIYNWLDKENLTPAVVVHQPLFITKYIDSCETLRKYMSAASSADDFEIIISDVLTKYLNIITILNQNMRNAQLNTLCPPPFMILLKRYFYGLTLHGPRDGRDIGKLENLRNRVISKFVWDKAEKRYSKCCEERNYYWIHGDFHLNNILINSEKEAFIIDFEDVYYGDPDIELAYWYVQMWILIYNKDGTFLKILNERVKSLFAFPYFHEEKFRDIVSLYMIPILLNRKWHSNEDKIEFSWLFLLKYLIR